jgi:hypothetical protein
MSLVNAWTEPARALVVVDTVCGRTDGARHEATKLVLLAHARTVIASRGYAEMLGILLQQYCLNGAADFDAVIASAPSSLQAAYVVLADPRRGGTPGDTEVTFVGWSESRQRFAVRVFRVGPEGLVDFPEQPWCVAPGDGLTVDDVPTYPDLAQIQALARRQVAIGVEQWPSHPDSHSGPPIIGGRLLVAEMLPPGRITIEAHPLD